MVKCIMRALSILVERFVTNFGGWKYIPGSEMKLVYLVPHRYRGKKIHIKDGTIVNDGDLVGEIHVDNLKMIDLEANPRKVVLLFRAELAALAHAINSDTELKDLRAVHGTTVLHSIMRRAGFTIIDIRTGPRRFCLELWENHLRRVFRNDEKRGNNREPKECWISCSQLLQFLNNEESLTREA